MKKFVIGDIHGNYKALLQCLDRSNFNREEDMLISLGDIVDGYSETYECVQELLSIKNLIAIRGNHDEVFYDWMIHGVHGFRWMQGANKTAESYMYHATESTIELKIFQTMGGYVTNLNILDIPKSHRDFFKNQHFYYIDESNRCFVHGGFDRWEKIQEQSPSMLIWDRDLWSQALSCKNGNLKTINNFNKIFIGHTTTMNWNTDKPMYSGGVWNLDTGAGWGGVLTIMNVDTEEYWQSDNADILYPNEKGR